MKDFFSCKRVESGRSDRECHMCRGVIPRGMAHMSVSQCSFGKLLSYRLHSECADLAGIMPRVDVLNEAASIAATAAPERIFYDRG